MKRTAVLLLALVMLLSGCVLAPAQTTLSAETTPPAESTAAPGGLRTIETDGIVRNLTGSERLLAVSTSDEDLRNVQLCVYDPATGEKLGAAAVEDPYPDIAVFPGGIACREWENQTLSVFTDRMELQWSRTLTPSETGLLCPDGSFYLFTDGSTLTRLRLPEQEGTTVAIPEGCSVMAVPQSRDEQCVVQISDAAAGTYRFIRVDWRTGQVEPVDPDEESAISQSRAHAVISGSREMLFRAPEELTVYLLPGEDLTTIGTGNGAALLSDAERALHFVSFDRGISRVLPTDGFELAVLCGSRVAYLPGGGSHAFTLWDPAGAGEDGPALQTTSMAGLAEATDQLAAELQEETGIDFRYGTDAVPLSDHFSCGYDARPVTDPMRIYVSLSEIGQVLRSYPAGMFDEIREAIGTPIRFYLTGPLSGIREDSVGSAQGLTLNTGTLQPVILDITQLESDHRLHNTVAHELMHVMEDRILQKDPKMTAFWDSFLPDPALYYYSYHTPEGSEVSDMGFTSWSDDPDPLFLDPYSRTKPTEDRARMMEYLWVGEGSQYAEFLKQGTLQEKARYLCAVIREAFPSCRDAEALPWESLLTERIPYTEYEAAVNAYEPPSVG